jgi:rod shape-determining protein MreD
VRRAALLALASLAAILIQLTMLNRLPLPGGAAPDLVLILVVAVGLTGGPMEGTLTGFCAGLAVDVAPPASHLVGQSALVFCVAGYAAGRLGAVLDRASWQPLGAVALCTAAGEALYAAAGMVFGDPGVSWPAVRAVLPVSVGYDLLVCPFALYAVAAASSWAAGSWAAGGFPARGGALAGPAASAGADGAVRDTGMGRSPRLRAGGARHGDGWIGGAGQRAGRAAAQALAARPVHLRLRGGQAGSARGAAVTRTRPAPPVRMHFSRGGSASSRPGGQTRRARPARVRFGRGGSVLGRRGSAARALAGRTPRGKAFSGRMPGGSALRSWAPGPRAFGGRRPRGSALRRSGPGGSAVSRGGASLGSRFGSATGKGAGPRFRRRPARGVSSRPRRGRLLRRGRGRARFGRRSTVWRIGSKRTGGMS